MTTDGGFCLILMKLIQFLCEICNTSHNIRGGERLTNIANQVKYNCSLLKDAVLSLAIWLKVDSVSCCYKPTNNVSITVKLERR